MNLPLDAVIINQTMKLVNRTMSENVIRKWIKLVAPKLDYAVLERQAFERKVRIIEGELREKHPNLRNVEEMPLSTDYILPHEFLFLLCNSVDRQTEMRKQKAPELDIEKRQIDNFDKDNVNGIRLDYLYKLDTDAWVSWYTDCQPSKRMVNDLNRDNKDKRVRIRGMMQWFTKGARNLEEDTQKAVLKLKKATTQKMSAPSEVTSEPSTRKYSMQDSASHHS